MNGKQARAWRKYTDENTEGFSKEAKKKANKLAKKGFKAMMKNKQKYKL